LEREKKRQPLRLDKKRQEKIGQGGKCKNYPYGGERKGPSNKEKEREREKAQRRTKGGVNSDRRKKRRQKRWKAEGKEHRMKKGIGERQGGGLREGLQPLGGEKRTQ